jgi:methylthioribose-1-phosphate isomerase
VIAIGVANNASAIAIAATMAMAIRINKGLVQSSKLQTRTLVRQSSCQKATATAVALMMVIHLNFVSPKKETVSVSKISARNYERSPPFRGERIGQERKLQARA